MNYACELANIEDLDTILNLYSERTQWFKENKIIAGFELSTNSKDWKDDITSAYYIHKVVTKVGYKNIGKIIFENCKKMAKLNSKKYLRLDCLKSNEKLNNIYESHNFKLIRYGSKECYSYALRELKINE